MATEIPQEKDTRFSQNWLDQNADLSIISVALSKTHRHRKHEELHPTNQYLTEILSVVSKQQCLNTDHIFEKFFSPPHSTRSALFEAMWILS